MKKLLLILLLPVGVISCVQEPREVTIVDQNKLKLKALEAKNDSMDIFIEKTQLKLDKTMEYTFKKIEFKNKRDECEIKYLKTSNEKYYHEGNRYVDSCWKYEKLLKELNQ